MRRERSRLFQLVLCFLKVGLIGFGGGSALIPVIEREAAKFDNKYVKKDFNKNVLAASLTPGALPVEIAGGVGEHLAGPLGMVLAAFAIAAPGALLTNLFLMLFSVSSEAVITAVGYAAVVINLFILWIIAGYVKKTLAGFGENRKLRAAAIIFGVFFVTSEAKLQNLFGMGEEPLFRVSTVTLFAVTFFVLLYTEGNFYTYRTVVAFFLAAVYFLEQENGAFYTPIGKKLAGTAMLILSIIGVVDILRKNTDGAKIKTSQLKALGMDIAVWIFVTAVFVIPAIMVSSKAFGFILRGLLSSFLSFGGGDAYLSIADAMFVESGMLESGLFYRQIVPVVNALPGSILCKTLSGIGFEIGGIWFAFAGLGISVSASCLIFIIIRYLYDCFSDLFVFQMLKRWIGTLIAGLLLSVALTMIMDNLSFLSQHWIF